VELFKHLEEQEVQVLESEQQVRQELLEAPALYHLAVTDSQYS
jgi:hypothetical protein